MLNCHAQRYDPTQLNANSSCPSTGFARIHRLSGMSFICLCSIVMNNSMLPYNQQFSMIQFVSLHHGSMHDSHQAIIWRSAESMTAVSCRRIEPRALDSAPHIAVCTRAATRMPRMTRPRIGNRRFPERIGDLRKLAAVSYMRVWS